MMAMYQNWRSISSGGLCVVFAMVVLMGASGSFSPAEEDSPPKPAESATPEGKLQVRKVLFLGNSITLHGPAPQIGWTGNWGMAASALEKDYVHLLMQQIASSSAAKPESMAKNIADFERQLGEYNLEEGLKSELKFEADLVIVAIGENAAALTTDEQKAKYRTAFAGLLAELKTHGQPTIIVRSCFWSDPAKDEIMQQVCTESGGVYVDAGPLGKIEANFARSERQIEHAGVAAHPGDQGMQAISDELWKAITKQSALWQP